MTIINFSAGQIRSLSAAQISALSVDQIRAFSITQLGIFNAVQSAALTKDQIGALSDAQVNKLNVTLYTAAQFDYTDATGKSVLSQLTGAQVSALSVKQASSLSPQQVASLSFQQIGSLMWRQLNTSVLSYLTTQQIQWLSASQLQNIWSYNKLSVEQIHALTLMQVAALPPSQFKIWFLPYLLPNQVGALTASQFSQWGDDSIGLLNASGFNKEQLQYKTASGREVVSILSPAQLGSLSTAIFANASADLISKITAMPDGTYSRIKMLSVEQIRAINIAFMSTAFMDQGRIELNNSEGQYMGTLQVMNVISPEQARGLTRNQIASLGYKVWNLTPDNLSVLTANQISWLDSHQLDSSMEIVNRKLQYVDASAFSLAQMMNLISRNPGYEVPLLNAASLTEDQLNWKVGYVGTPLRQYLTRDQLVARESYSIAGLTKESDAQIQGLDARYLATLDALNTYDSNKHTVIGALTDSQLTRLAATTLNQMIQVAASDMLWLHQNAPALSTSGLTVQSTVALHQTVNLTH